MSWGRIMSKKANLTLDWSLVSPFVLHCPHTSGPYNSTSSGGMIQKVSNKVIQADPTVMLKSIGSAATTEPCELYSAMVKASDALFFLLTLNTARFLTHMITLTSRKVAECRFPPTCCFVSVCLACCTRCHVCDVADVSVHSTLFSLVCVWYVFVHK